MRRLWLRLRSIRLRRAHALRYSDAAHGRCCVLCGIAEPISNQFIECAGEGSNE